MCCTLFFVLACFASLLTITNCTADCQHVSFQICNPMFKYMVKDIRLLVRKQVKHITGLPIPASQGPMSFFFYCSISFRCILYSLANIMQYMDYSNSNSPWNKHFSGISYAVIGGQPISNQLPTPSSTSPFSYHNTQFFVGNLYFIAFRFNITSTIQIFCNLPIRWFIFTF